MKAGKARQANLPLYENDRKFPTAELVKRHAEMLGQSTADLMLGVVTDYDRVRWPLWTDTQIEQFLTGLGLLSEAQRTAIFESCAEKAAPALVKFQTDVERLRARRSKPAIPAITKKTHRQMKGA